MTWLCLSLTKMRLKNNLSVYQKRLLDINQRIMDLQRLAAGIADGVLNYQEATTMPSSVFGTQMNYLAQSSNIAYQSANIKTNSYLQQMQMINQTTGGQYQYALDPTVMTGCVQNGQIQPFLLFNNVYKEELKAYAQQYSETLNREEKELEQEKLTLETQIKAIEAEYQTVEEQESENIKNDAIKLS